MPKKYESLTVDPMRKEDDGKSEEDLQSLMQMRSYPLKWINKVTFSFIGILLSILGIISWHWLTTFEKAILFNEAKFKTILIESKQYTDSIMAQHIKELQPFWSGVTEMKRTVADTHEQVQRITNFMEFKYGMSNNSNKK